MNELIFYKSKRQRLKSGITFSVLLLTFIYVMLFFYEKEEFFYLLIFFILTVISAYSLTSVVFNKPTVIVDEKGIRNNTNMMGLIKWSFIIDFEIKTIMKRELFVIKLNNKDGFLNEKNFFSKSLMKTNVNKLESPAVIGEFEFDAPLEVVLEKIKIFRESL